MRFTDLDWRQIFQSWTNSDLEYLQHMINQELDNRKKYYRGLGYINDNKK